MTAEPMPADLPRFLRTKEAIEYLSIPPHIFYRLVKNGEIPQIKFTENAQPRYARTDLDAFMESKRNGGQQ